MPRHVVSTTRRDPEWANTTVNAEDILGQGARLRERAGGTNLVVGSRTPDHSLMGHDLIDEYRLLIFPVILGSGRRLFPETAGKTVVRLVDSHTFSSGVVGTPITRSPGRGWHGHDETASPGMGLAAWPRRLARGLASDEALGAPVVGAVVVGVHAGHDDAGALVLGTDEHAVADVDPDVTDPGAEGILVED